MYVYIYVGEFHRLQTYPNRLEIQRLTILVDPKNDKTGFIAF